MARPVKRKAQKDYPQNNIKKGEEYYYVKIKTGPRSSRVMRQKEPFKPSQLTSSEFLSALYEWEEEKSNLSSMEDAQALADRIREIGEEQQDKFDNMPEGLQQGDTGQMIEARAQGCEAAASDIEEIVSEWENAKEAIDEWENYKTRVENGEVDDDEVEPDEPEETEDDFIGRIRDVEVEHG